MDRSNPVLPHAGLGSPRKLRQGSASARGSLVEAVELLLLAEKQELRLSSPASSLSAEELLQMRSRATARSSAFLDLVFFFSPQAASRSCVTRRWPLYSLRRPSLLPPHRSSLELQACGIRSASRRADRRRVLQQRERRRSRGAPAAVHPRGPAPRSGDSGRTERP
nr:unnamed protein product [Digitaria exilis]